MKRLLICCMLAVMMVGCTSARISKDLSAGVIGCLPDEIQIINETASVSGTHNWIAECNGKRFVCNYVYGSTTTCKEYVK